MLSWVGLAVASVLVVLVTVRIVRSPLPEPLSPMLCIYAAPPSMCLAAYLSCAVSPNAAFAAVLYALSCASYLVGLMNLIVCLRIPFYPTYAAMTFPFVIAASASLKFIALFPGLAFASLVAWAQVAVACLAVSYVLVRYLAFLFGKHC